MKVEENKPKVLFADFVSTSKDSILVRELATMLKQNSVGMGQNRLFAWLRENGFKSVGRNRPQHAYAKVCGVGAVRDSGDSHQ